MLHPDHFNVAPSPGVGMLVTAKWFVRIEFWRTTGILANHSSNAQVHAGVADQERISCSLAELEAYRAKLAEEYTVKLTGSDTWMKAE
jgi:hypothetical protein